MTLEQIATALAASNSTSFGAIGGTAPYVYKVRPNGAGGSINSSSGVYVAPATVNSDPAKAFDVIQVRDSLGVIATAKVLVTTPLGLLCDILQNQLGLSDGRVYFWDQKIFQPTDSDLYLAVSVPTCKPFGNNNRFTSNSGLLSGQYVSMQATVDIDIMSRSSAARDKKEQVLIALNSVYSEKQQESNGFYISRIPTGFVNLSNIDGAAIPYRYKISVAMQYAATADVQINYFDSFNAPTVTVNA